MTRTYTTHLTSPFIHGRNSARDRGEVLPGDPPRGYAQVLERRLTRLMGKSRPLSEHECDVVGELWDAWLRALAVAQVEVQAVGYTADGTPVVLTWAPPESEREDSLF